MRIEPDEDEAPAGTKVRDRPADAVRRDPDEGTVIDVYGGALDDHVREALPRAAEHARSVLWPKRGVTPGSFLSNGEDRCRDGRTRRGMPQDGGPSPLDQTAGFPVPIDSRAVCRFTATLIRQSATIANTMPTIAVSASRLNTEGLASADRPASPR